MGMEVSFIIWSWQNCKQVTPKQLPNIPLSKLGRTERNIVPVQQKTKRSPCLFSNIVHISLDYIHIIALFYYVPVGDRGAASN